MMTVVVLPPFSTHQNALIGSFPAINKKLLSIVSFPLLRGEGIIKKIEFLVISISICHLSLVGSGGLVWRLFLMVTLVRKRVRWPPSFSWITFTCIRLFWLTRLTILVRLLICLSFYGADEANYMDILKEALVRTIHDIDAAFTKEAYRFQLYAGSTAVIAVVVDGHILVANVGDSKALLCSQKILSDPSGKACRPPPSNGVGCRHIPEGSSCCGNEMSLHPRGA